MMMTDLNTNELDVEQSMEGMLSCSATETTCAIRKEKRKAAKKDKRKQKRRELAEKLRIEEDARINDPEEQRRIQLEEEAENQRLERERKEFEERERLFLEELARRKAEEEEEERIRAIEEEERLKQNQAACENEEKDDEEWEYVEDGPPEIIWQGNEIIVKKNRIRVKKKDVEHLAVKEDPSRPTSNPLPPQSEAFDEYNNASTLSAQGLLENVAQQTPNFGTEQDKAHCPFHIKTGACRFGAHCSRIHFYPDKSCTLLVKNMYNGPGLAWEQDEGLECTDEEVEHCYEEFYEDVHTEFLKFGEIVNFKVCRNSSSHLRGNVYVHYKSLDSAVLAYHSINGRYFAGKQIICEFASVTRWKVAICGEFMKSRLKTCSRGTACNFIHCFRNPGGDYEWADWDKPPPNYWIKKMAALFGYSEESIYDRQIEREDSEHIRHHSERSQSRESRWSRSREDRSLTSHKEHDVRRREHRKHPKGVDEKRCEEERNSRTNQRHKNSSYDDSKSDRHWSAKHRDGLDHCDSTRKRSRHPVSERSESQDRRDDGKSRSSSTDSDSDSDSDLFGRKREGDAELGHTTKNTRHVKKAPEGLDDLAYSKSRAYSTDRNRESHHNARGRSSSKYQNTVSVSSDDHWDNKTKSPRRNANGDQTAGVKDSQRANSRKSSRCLNEVSLDNDDVQEYKRSDEDHSGYVGSISQSPRYHTGEDIDERGRWGAYGKHVESSKRKASDYSHKERKKKHRSHHSRSDKGDS
ncbi:PREDICTED: zinc finger CCCH domain-containing protein 16 [Ipomoea nil]|uniref:zinc finger CCCH domain-containing protein 16 n=1 Tax=Ipomoea nil TaxID=35883 RepID=UPI000901753A|nr:PREDICTED: zinc finger CCCH domain-containing protein 16 [Ipomoea nil]